MCVSCSAASHTAARSSQCFSNKTCGSCLARYRKDVLCLQGNTWCVKTISDMWDRLPVNAGETGRGSEKRLERLFMRRLTAAPLAGRVKWIGSVSDQIWSKTSNLYFAPSLLSCGIFTFYSHACRLSPMQYMWRVGHSPHWELMPHWKAFSPDVSGIEQRHQQCYVMAPRCDHSKHYQQESRVKIKKKS